MPLMREYTEIVVDEELLPQVVRELVFLAEDQNHVEVTHGVTGRVILVHPALADKWYQQVTAPKDEDDSDKAADASEEVSPEAEVAESITPETTITAANIAARELSMSVPVKRGPGRPRKYPPAPSVSNGEES